MKKNLRNRGENMAKKTMAPMNCPCGFIDENPYSRLAGAGEEIMRPAVLLHSCCGPCSTSVIERLAPDYDVTVFFYNPCITEAEEYEKRKENQIKFIDAYNQKLAGSQKIHFIEGDYLPEEYFARTKGYEDEPEGGARCTICFTQRLYETAKTAKKRGYGIFATTLTVSPHKNYPLISEIGNRLAKEENIEFLDLDFKKKAGFQRSIQLSKEYGLYRQNYCGCEYSKR